jgi:KipI family sensor histidine kinase inhibitor
MITGVTPLGDTALVVEVEDVAAAHRVAAAVDEAREAGLAPEGIEETVIGFGSVVVHLDPLVARPVRVEQWLTALNADEPSATPGADRRHLDIPATFDGSDLGAVADLIGTTPASVVERLTAIDLEVAFIGFAPGFPYLVGLPPELAAIPRRPSPRSSVPAGSVAVAGGFASVYPQSTPGGWMLLGRTPVRLFDPDRPPYALLSPGDTVRFSDMGDTGDVAVPEGTVSVATTAGGGPGHAPAPRGPLTAPGDRLVEVLDAGLLSLIEDQGRSGVAGLGVPRAGAADPEAMRLANRLVGNGDGAAAIEVTAVGPRLRFRGDAHVGVVASTIDGVDVHIDGLPVAAGGALPVRDGQVLQVGRVRAGLRAYVAVSGAFATPPVVGSRSSDMLAGLGLGPLRSGDQLRLGPAVRPHGQLLEPVDVAAGDDPTVLRVMAGPHRLPTLDLNRLCAAGWTVGDESNRIGVRLTGSGAGGAAGGPGIPSLGMVTGAIQVPPDGQPIILGPDHATVGGYPVIACVISADLPVVGQLRPGDTVILAVVDRATAQRERQHREHLLDGRVVGWFPTAAGT